jgi:predicted O-methyltransferase YrrM
MLDSQSLKAMMSPVIRALRRTPERAEKDYATHLPVLIGLANVSRIQRVLEFGCGQFSTLTFLDRAIFPDLQHLETLENDQSWLEKVLQSSSRDARLKTTLVNGEMESTVGSLPLNEFDLIFVDDSTSAEQRAKTIAAIAARRVQACVAIHDFEVQVYRQASSPFEHRHIFRSYNPETAVVWNGDSTKARSMRAIDSVLKRFSRKLAPDDVVGWKTAFTPE